MELPFSIMRRATIPCDACWDARRRKWCCATPPCAAALLCLKYNGDVASTFEANVGGVPVLVLFPLLLSPAPYMLLKVTSADEPPHAFTALVATGFCLSIVWMDLLASEVVALIETLGFMLGLSTSLLGLTLIAWGNSAGDMIANTTVAKGGEEGDCKKGAKMALAACFGSPLLMNLIGTGGALSAHMIVNGGAPVEAFISQNCRIAYLFLSVAITSHIIIFPWSGYAPPRRYAFYLFSLYGFFILFILLAEANALGTFLM